MNDADIPEVDRQDGTNHPRHTEILMVIKLLN